MRPRLLSWQWSLYADGHKTRTNLVLHVLTEPLFLLGIIAILGALWRPYLALGGLAAIAVALIAQGRGHRGEPVRPVPFEGPLDFVSRFFVEQWVTFPRFILSGGFARAWREASGR